MAEVGNW